MSQLIVAKRLQAGLDEDPLHRAPKVVLVGGVHAVHLPLTADGVSVLLTGDAQEDVGAHVFETHHVVPLPVLAIALNRPHVQIVSLAILPERTDFL